MKERDAVLAFVVAFAAAALLTPLAARFATRIGAVDHPRDRGLATRDTPLLGGLAIFAAVVISSLLFLKLDGQQAEDRLHEIGITVNRNSVPFDPRPPMVTSGLRVGTPALATRGLQADDFTEVGQIIATALTPEFEGRRSELTERVTAIADRYPLYAQLGTPAAV